jgi:hypothetical protein
VLVLVCGSRELSGSDWMRIYTRLEQLPDGTTVMHGDARGVDRKVEEFCRTLSIPCRAFPADWERYGKRAGHVRNAEMLDKGPELVLAFWDGHSKGTENVIREARIRGIPLEVIPISVPG